MPDSEGHIVAKDITVAYGDFVVQRDLNFTVNRGDVFIIMGGSGCGKSTLLKVMIGLKSPAVGEVYYDGDPFWRSGPDHQEDLKRNFGILFQSGALFSSMTLAENIGLPPENIVLLKRALNAANSPGGAYSLDVILRDNQRLVPQAAEDVAFPAKAEAQRLGPLVAFVDAVIDMA